MPDFFLIEVSSGVIFMGQREYYRFRTVTVVLKREDQVLRRIPGIQGSSFSKPTFSSFVTRDKCCNLESCLIGLSSL